MRIDSFESRKRFNLCYEVNKNVVKCYIDQYVENLHLEAHNPEERVRKLLSEFQLLKQEAKNCKRKEFLYFADKQSCLYNVMSCQLLINNCDEEPQMLEGLTLCEKLKCIIGLLKEAKGQLPPFKEADFLQGSYNVLFYEQNERPLGTSKQDYFRMRSRQVHQMVECIDPEFNGLRHRLIEGLNDSSLWKDFARLELQLVEEVLENGRQWTPDELALHLSRLMGLLPGSLPEDMLEFQGQFGRFDPKKSFSYVLSPQMIQQAKERIGQGKLSQAPICLGSLIRYKRWLTDVLQEKRGLKDPCETNYDLLFEQVVENNLSISKKKIQFLKIKYQKETVKQEKYQVSLFEKLEEIRYEFSHLSYSEYYQLLLNRENTKSHFINQCCLDTDLEDQICQLGKAIVMNETIKFIKSELFQIDERLIKPSLDMGHYKIHFEEIISAMIPNPQISEQLWNAFDKMSFSGSGRKPYLFMVEDFKDSVRTIFQQQLVYFKNVLDCQPSHIIESYAHHQLIELELLALVSPEFGMDLIEYLKDLKKMLKLQRKSFYSPPGFRLAPTESLYNDLQTQVIKTERDLQTKGIKTNKIKILSFYYKEVKDDKLALVLKALVILGAVSADLTVPQFRAIYKGEHVTCPVEWLGSLSDLATFIKESIRINGPGFIPCKQPWKITAKCFVQKGGMAFDPQKLRLSKPTMLEGKFEEAARKFK